MLRWPFVCILSTGLRSWPFPWQRWFCYCPQGKMQEDWARCCHKNGDIINLSLNWCYVFNDSSVWLQWSLFHQLQIDKTLMRAAGMVNRVKQEVAIHSRLKHPAVLELYTFFEDSSYVYLVLELCHNGELQRYLKKHDRILNEDEGMLSHFISESYNFVTPYYLTSNFFSSKPHTFPNCSRTSISTLSYSEDQLWPGNTE